MVPVDHPHYRGFDLTEIDCVKTPGLREVADRLDRADLDTGYQCFQVVVYARENGREATSRAELLTVPKANRARITEGPKSEGIDCESPEEAVRTWLRRGGPDH